MRFAVFAISFVSILSLLASYMAWRLLSPAKLGRLRNLIVIAAIACFILTIPVLIIIRRTGMESTAFDIIAGAAYIGLGFMSFVFMFLLMRDMVWLFIIIIKKIRKWLTPKNGSTPYPNPLPSPDRRRFIINSVNAGILTGAGALTGYGMMQAKKLPGIKTIRIPFSNLSPDLDGLRIVQLTDIHVSATTKRPFVEKVVDAVNKLSPDIITITGDLVDGSVSHLSHDVDPLKNLRSTFGNFFVTGNHEYYSGVDHWVNKIRELGFTALMNENRLIHCGEGRLLLAGVTDFRGGRFGHFHRSDPTKAIDGAASSDLKVLLAHQPKSIFGAAEAGFDLQISGHTHGGQFFPWTCFVHLAQPFDVGLHQYKNTKLYVSGGTGYWGPPVRVGSPSEITLIELISA